MANIKSAEKRIRQNEVRRERNRAVTSTMRTAIKKVRRSLEDGNLQAAEAALPSAIQTIDVSVRKGVVHRNTGARTKSRLVRAVQNATASPAD